MAALRALAYFFEEALLSLWRSRLVSLLSVGSIAVSLFVVGAFLAVGLSLGDVVARWSQKVQVVLYLEDPLEDRIRKSLEDRLTGDPAVETVELVTRAMALERFQGLFRDLAALPDDLGQNPFPPRWR
jgi:cell division transport system permease protein